MRLKITAALIGCIGLPMIWMGAELALVGGTPYYLLAGILMSLSAVELWRAQRRGFFLYAALLLFTLAWAVFEAGTDFWLVGSRIWLIGLISLWLCTPGIRRQLWSDGSKAAPKLLHLRTVQICAVASVVLLGLMTINLLDRAVLPIEEISKGPTQNSSDWNAYGANNAGTRFVPHKQINLENVGQLTQAWQADTSRVGRFSGTPIQIDDARKWPVAIKSYLQIFQNRVLMVPILNLILYK